MKSWMEHKTHNTMNIAVFTINGGSKDRGMRNCGFSLEINNNCLHILLFLSFSFAFFWHGNCVDFEVKYMLNYV